MERHPDANRPGEPAYTAEKRIENGSPVLYVNGRRQAPLLYALSDIPASSPLTAQAQRNMANFARQGVRLFSTDANLCRGWHKAQPYRADFLLGDLAAIVETVPQAAILVRLHMNAPYWWMRDNPDELCVYGTGGAPYVDDGDHERLIEGDEQNRMRVSLASRKWLREAGEKLEELLGAVRDTPKGRHVVGIQISGGVYGEWHQWGFTHHPDYGVSMVDRFREFLREQYVTVDALRNAWKDADVTFDAAAPATPEERTRDLYRIPADCRRVVDSLVALQRCAPDAIVHFADIVRRTWGRPLIVGTFYGYYDPWPAGYVGGHLETHRLYGSGRVDFISGPFPYWPEVRAARGVAAARGLLESARLNGVIWLTEMDNPPVDSTHHVGGDPARRSETIALMRRNILEPFTRGMGAWFYDHRLVLETGLATSLHIKKGWWDHPELLAEVRRLRRLADRVSLGRPYRPVADVLLVYDNPSRYYHNASDAFTGGTMPQTVEAMGRCGVAYDRIYFDDLERCDIDRYRCVAMINVCLLTQERRRMVRRRVQGGGRHVLWMNTCGLLDEDACSAALVGEACQIAVAPCPAAASMRFSAPLPPKEVALREAYSVMFKVDDADACPVAVFTDIEGTAAALKPMEDHTSWYFSLFPADPDVLREIFRFAGAHIYSENGEALLVGNGLAVVTATDDRPLELTLRNGMVVREALPSMTTAVYDADTGRRLL